MGPFGVVVARGATNPVAAGHFAVYHGLLPIE